MNLLQRALDRADGIQRRHPVLSFPVAVGKKFSDDRAGWLAAVIAYYGFLSLFPLLLVFVTVLGFVLRDDIRLQAKILSSTLANFPIIGEQIRENIGSLSGSGGTLIAGLAAALWAGIGGVRAFQRAMNDVWDVPRDERPGLVRSVLRAMLTIATVGTVLIVGAVLPARGSGVLLTALGIVVSVSLNFTLFLLVFRLLTVADVSWRDVAPGAAVAAVGWAILQSVGGWYLSTRLQGASEVYGFFGIVIGLLAWIALGAQLTLFAAEVNVVRAKRLWPRSMTEHPAPQPSPAPVQPVRRAG